MREELERREKKGKVIVILAAALVAIALLYGYWADFQNDRVDATTGPATTNQNVSGEQGGAAD